MKNTKQNYSIIFTLFFLLVFKIHTQSSSIGSKKLFTLNTNDKNIVLLNGLENLDIKQFQDNKKVSTKVTINYLTRNPSTMLNKKSLDIDGSWNYLIGSNQKLSCNLIYQPNIEQIGLLVFDRLNLIFELKSRFNFSLLLSITNISDISQYSHQNITIGEKCQFVKVNNNIFMFKDNQINKIQTLNSWSIQDYSKDFKYILADYKLYRFDLDKNLYNQVYTFPTFNNVNLQNYQNRLIFYGQNSTLSLGIPYIQYKINISAYYLLDQGNILTLSNFSINNALFIKQYVPIFTSFKLTKTGFGYVDKEQFKTIMVARSIDYKNKIVNQIACDNVDRFVQTTLDLDPNNYDLNDDFFVTRNSSVYKFNNDLLDQSQAVEDVYQFKDNKFILLASRKLTSLKDTTENSQKQVNNFQKVFIDYSVKNELVVLDSYQNQRNQIEVYQYRYGSLNTDVVSANDRFIHQPIN